MGLRKYKRGIAKARLAKMGFRRRQIGTGMERSRLRKLMKTNRGRRLLAKLRAKDKPIWRKVLEE